MGSPYSDQVTTSHSIRARTNYKTNNLVKVIKHKQYLVDTCTGIVSQLFEFQLIIPGTWTHNTMFSIPADVAIKIHCYINRVHMYTCNEQRTCGMPKLIL